MDCVWMWQQTCAYDSEASAAWVQAVGSIAAIGIAITLARFDSARQRRQVRERAAAIVRLAIAHCERFVGMLYEIDFDPADNPHVTFGTLNKLIDEFPLERLETAAAIEELVRLQGLLAVVQEKVEACLSTLQQTGKFFDPEVTEASNAFVRMRASGRILLLNLK